MFGGDVHKTDAFDEDIFSVPKSVPDKHVPDKQVAEKQPNKSDQSLPTSVVCWKLLQAVWIQIRPDKMSGWPGSKLSATLMVILKEFF